MKHVTRGLLTLTAVGFISGPTLVNAGTAYQGDDTTNYFRNSSGNWVMQVCDNESDGYGVHGDFTFNYNRDHIRFDESGGADSACDTKAPGTSGIQGLWRHRTVEERPDAFELDVKGEYHYH